MSRHDPRRRAVERREFLKSAVAIGGASALSACLDREDDAPQGFGTSFHDELEENPLPEGQHVFGPYLVTDPHGNTVVPMHNILLMLDYRGEDGDPPSDDERRRVEDGFRTLERAYEWGVGDAVNAVVNHGLLFAHGYSPYFFERVYGERPEKPALDAEELLDEIDDFRVEDFERPDADRYDAFLYLTSGYASNVLGAEEALFGDLDEVNGVEVEGGLDDVFEVRERRTGFIGQTLATRHWEGVDDPESSVAEQPERGLDVASEFDDNPIPMESPLFMGFKSGFTTNLPSEDDVTIQEGSWKDGTVAQISRTKLELEDWYREDHGDRVEMMFSPRHDKEQVGETAQDLASSDRLSEEMVDAASEDARDRDVVGHSQKLAAARDDGFTPKVTRRDFNSTDGGEAGMEFIGFMREIDAFVELQRAMHGDHLDIEPERNGILEFFEVPKRATFLVPPRRLRALPTPEPRRA